MGLCCLGQPVSNARVQPANVPNHEHLQWGMVLKVLHFLRRSRGKEAFLGVLGLKHDELSLGWTLTTAVRERHHSATGSQALW